MSGHAKNDIHYIEGNCDSDWIRGVPAPGNTSKFKKSLTSQRLMTHHSNHGPQPVDWLRWCDHNGITDPGCRKKCDESLHSSLNHKLAAIWFSYPKDCNMINYSCCIWRIVCLWYNNSSCCIWRIVFVTHKLFLLYLMEYIHDSRRPPGWLKGGRVWRGGAPLRKKVKNVFPT